MNSSTLSKSCPEIGLHTLETGQTLIGTTEIKEAYRDRFERETVSVGLEEFTT